MDTPATVADPLVRTDSTVVDRPPGLPVSAVEAFAALDHAHRELVAAEVAELVAIVHACDLYEVDTEVIWAGAERLIWYGHAGTPSVGEFVTLEIGALLGLSPESAAGRISDALDLRWRHPVLFGEVLAGRVRVWQAMVIVRQAGYLSVEAVGRLDTMIGAVVGRMPAGRILKALPGWMIAADPQAAARRDEQALLDRQVRISGIEHGSVGIWGRLDARDGIDLDAAVSGIEGVRCFV